MRFAVVKTMCRSMVACVILFVSLQFAYAQTGSQSPSSSLLDDLLVPNGEQAKNKEQRAEDKKIGTLAEELNAISGQMDSAAMSLESSRELDTQSVAKALKHQQDAIDALNRLLQKNGGKMSRQSSGDKGAEQEQADSKEPNQPKDTPSGKPQDDKESQSPSQDPQSGDKPGEQSSQSDSNSTPKQNDQKDPSGKTNGQDAKGMPTKETVVDLLKSIDASGKANWGKLPQRLRDQMQNSGSLEFTRGYEQQTRDYFRNLNDALLKLKSPPAK